jgi:transposase
MSLSSWLVAGIVPGVERQPLKKLAVDANALLKLLNRWREESRTQDRTHCSCLRGRPGWFLAGALAQGTRHRGPRYPRIERSGIA